MPRGQILFRYGDTGDNFFIVISGQAQLYVHNPERAAVKGVIKDLREKQHDAKERLQRLLNANVDELSVKESI